MKRLFSISILGMVLIALLGCSKSDKKKEQVEKNSIVSQLPAPYTNWEIYSYDGIQIIYPPDHPLKGTFYDVARGYQTILRRSCQFLQIPVPDTIRIYFYTGYGQGQQMTGKEYPFATDDAIHFWIPSFYGPPLLQYLIPRWIPQEPTFKFLREGIIALLDFSGQNYHQLVLKLIDDNMYVPLTKLANDTLVNSNEERLQSAEAASFVDYLVYTYGMQTFKRLYISPEKDFEKATGSIYNISPDSLQTLWLSFVRSVAVKYDSTQAE